LNRNRPLSGGFLFHIIFDKIEIAVVGFSLISDRHAAEDLFISSLPDNLKKRELQLSIVLGRISVDNGMGGIKLFKIPYNELSVFRNYIASDETEAEIKLCGLIPTARVILTNERVRKESISSL
jgi:hypothetical protein